MPAKSLLLLLLPFAAFAVGMLLPLQAGANAQLRGYLGNPVLAALISFSAGTLALIVILLVLRAPLPSREVVARVPFWVWITGGWCGAVYITAVILLAPRLGSATTFGLIVTGQFAMAIALDHFGAIGFPVHPISFWRLLGAVLLIVGVVLIQRF